MIDISPFRLGIGKKSGSVASQLLLTSTGSGIGVSTLKMTVSEDVIITLGLNASFYSDAGGTLNASQTWTITSGAERTIYLKCTTGTAIFNINKNKITNWSTWTSGANAASIGGDMSTLTALTYLTISGNNTLSGSFNALTSLTTFEIYGNNILTGDPKFISDGMVYLNIIGDNRIVDYTSGGNWGSIWDTISIQPSAGYGLSSAEVDLLLQEISATKVESQAVNVTLVGNAARTAASNVAVADIITDGGTVVTT